MDNIVNFQDIIGASQGDQSHMLGKFLYFSLSNILVEKDQLAALCETLHIPYAGGKRVSVADAFRSATGDIKDRLIIKQDGEQKIYAIYCRDNERTSKLLSRELVKETMNRQTNQYEKLANISYDKADGVFRCDNMVMDDAVDVRECCRKAEELFELYQSCANRKQIETMKAVMRRMEQSAATGAITPEFVNEYIDKIFVTPENDHTLRLDIKIFTGEATQRYFEKLELRTGHTFKKMIEAYEQGMQ